MSANPKSIPLLFDQVTKNFPQLNILINNAGIMRKINLHDTTEGPADIAHEIETNLSVRCEW